jgi:hypothetical protein
MNGSPYTNIMSTANMTLLFKLIISLGTSTYSAIAPSGVHQTVFPFSVAMSGPNILLAFVMSMGDTGQFVIILDLTIFMKSFGEGYPTRSRTCLAYLAFSNSRLLKPSRSP